MKIKLREGKKTDTRSSGMIKGGFIKFSFNFPFYKYRIKKQKQKNKKASQFLKELDGYQLCSLISVSTSKPRQWVRAPNNVQFLPPKKLLPSRPHCIIFAKTIRTFVLKLIDGLRWFNPSKLKACVRYLSSLSLP